MAKNDWRCTVCGYVHIGETPPDGCPLCGATAEYFEVAPQLPKAAAGTPSNWRCINCDYLHEGDSPPERCPVCGAGPEQFQPAAGSATSVATRATTGRIVVVGGGIAGLSAAEAARNAAPRPRSP